MDKVESGQAVVEYILLLAIVVSLYAAIIAQLQASNVMDTMKKPFTVQLKYTYQYGNAASRGQSDGGPIDIPLYHDDSMFRIFINPPISDP